MIRLFYHVLPCFPVFCNILPCFTHISTSQIPHCCWWNRRFFRSWVKSSFSVSQRPLRFGSVSRGLGQDELAVELTEFSWGEHVFFVGWCSSYKPPLRDVFFVDVQWPRLMTGGYTLWPTIRVCYRKSFRERWIFWIMAKKSIAMS